MTRRILYCEQNTDGTVGGSYYSLLYLTGGIDHARYRPFVVFHFDHVLVPHYREAGCEVAILPKPAPVAFPVGGPIRLAQKGANVARTLLAPAWRNYRFLARNRIDLVHLNNSILYNHDWMIAALLRGIPCITHERGINDRFPPLARRMARSLSAVVCISDAVRDNMLSRGVRGKRIVRIHNGIDPASVRPARPPEEVRRSLGIGAGDRVIGVVGNIKRWKGQETAVLAMARLRDRHPGLRCLLVGQVGAADREYGERIERMIGSEGLEGRVILTGFQENVADFVNVMEIVLHTSIDPEPFGRVLLEAMALRKPVIGTGIGAVPEIVLDGETGLLVPPGDPSALAAALGRLLDDPATARRWGVDGFQRLNESFRIEKNIEETEALYREILGDD